MPLSDVRPYDDLVTELRTLSRGYGLKTDRMAMLRAAEAIAALQDQLTMPTSPSDEPYPGYVGPDDLPSDVSPGPTQPTTMGDLVEGLKPGDEDEHIPDTLQE